MEKKYIVKLGRCERLYKAYIVNGKPNLTWLSPEVDLTPYTEPDLEQVKADAYNDGYKAGREAEKVRQPDIEQVRKEAYQRGYCEALEKHCEICEEKHDAEEAYQQGLNDAWECARKIIHMPEGDLLNIFTECYSSVCTALQVILKYDADEVIEKLKTYEQEQETIQVGDEVGYYGVADEHGNVNYSGVVLEIRKDDYLVMEKDGKTYALKKKLVMSKTDRHFPEIAAVLAKMREGQEQ